jgi:hypothetical protein
VPLALDEETLVKRALQIFDRRGFAAVQILGDLFGGWVSAQTAFQVF